MKQTSLGELAIKLGINKSKLAFFFSLGLLKSIARIGKMNIFDEESTLKTLKKIDVLKKEGKSLREIIQILE